MLALRTRALTGLVMVASACGLAAPAQAQLFPWINPCGACAQPVPMAMIQTVSVCDCPCMKPISETVYQDVQRVEYRPEQKTVKVAKVVTIPEDREVTTYQTVNETRTAEVPTCVAQTVTECQPVTYNQSYWRTTWQPVPKCAPCQIDNRPGLLAEFNRIGLAMRNSVTPNFVARREFVPNIITAQVPVQRTVQVPATRQVTYNVSRVVPTTTVQKVPVQRVVWEDQTVTAMVPFTTTQRVAVGTRTRLAYIGGPGTTASASAEPTPATANSGLGSGQSASNNKGSARPLATPQNEPPIQLPTHRREVQPVRDSVKPDAQQGPVATTPAESPTVVRVTGWRTTRSTTGDAQPVRPSPLSVVQK